MTVKEIEDELFAIAKIEHNDVRTGEPWTSSDRIDQDQLFALQEKFMDLIDKINQKRAAREFPWAYRVVNEETPV